MLDIKNIFIVIGRGVTRKEVVNLIKKDGYIDNFIFGDRFKREDREIWEELMLDCDEIWVFGETNRTFEEGKWQHSFAKKNGLEIWMMG